MGYVLVFVGAGLGGVCRQLVNVAFIRWIGAGFPFATLTINVTGSFLMGLLAGYFIFRGNGADNWRLFLTTGVLGGYTTFSTFSLDSVALFERGEVTAALLYVLVSVTVSILALFGALQLARGLLA